LHHQHDQWRFGARMQPGQWVMWYDDWVLHGWDSVGYKRQWHDDKLDLCR
jgi:hypothetical protein